MKKLVYLDAMADPEVAQRGKEQEQEVDSARLIVEVEREDHHIENTGCKGPAQLGIEEDKGEEKKEKEPAREDHRRLCIVAQELDQTIPKGGKCGQLHGYSIG